MLVDVSVGGDENMHYLPWTQIEEIKLVWDPEEKGKQQQTSKPGDMLNIKGKEERGKFPKIISKF